MSWFQCPNEECELDRMTFDEDEHAVIDCPECGEVMEYAGEEDSS